MKSPRPRDAYDTASRFLATREYSSQQIRTKLKQRGFTKDEIEEALEKLIRHDYLNDSRFTHSLVEFYAFRRLRGPMEVRMRLQKAGIDRELASDTIAEIFTPEVEKDLCLQDAQKKAVALKEEDRQKRYAKLVGYLSRHGFSSDAVRYAVDEVLNNQSEVDDNG